MPFGTGTPKSRRIALAWYSWMFMPCPRPRTAVGASAICRASGTIRTQAWISPSTAATELSNICALGLVEIDLDDALDALGADHHRHADVAVA